METRALTQTATSDIEDLKNGGFKVLGYAGSVEIFNNEQATKKEGNSKVWWEMANKKYWADNTEYNFFALYSANTDENYKFESIVSDAKTSATLKSFKNTGNDDLILAGTNVKTTTGSNGAGRGDAHMTFKHALSRVAFKFVNAYESTGTLGENGTANTIALKIENLALVNEAGSADVTIDNKDTEDEGGVSDKKSLSNITWSELTNKSDISYMNDGVFGDSEQNFIAQNNNVVSAYKYILPAENRKLTLKCKITALDSDGNTIRVFDFTGKNDKTGAKDPLTVTLSTPENAQADATLLTHVAGQSYTYTMTVSETLNEIKFDVDVEDWIINEEQEIEFPNK